MAFSPGLDKSLGASCKDSIGWMFSKLDTSADLFLDQTELAAINLDKYEVCIRPFFNSCDTYKDGRVSTAEWCFCFWRESEWGPLPRPPACHVGSALHSRPSLGVRVAPTQPPPTTQNLVSSPASCTLQQIISWSPGKPARGPPSSAGPRWILWVLKLMYFWRPTLRKSIKNYKCKISRAPQRAWERLRGPKAEASLAS